MLEKINSPADLAHLSQEELAEKLGVKRSVISKYETSRVVNLKRETIAELAKALNVRPSWLMCMEDKPQTTTVELSDKEKALIDLFRSLNDEGQSKAYDYLVDLQNTGTYQKGLTVSAGVLNI